VTWEAEEPQDLSRKFHVKKGTGHRLIDHNDWGHSTMEVAELG
jgi:hypothetical protein